MQVQGLAMNLDKMFAWGLIVVVAVGIFGGFLRKESQWLGELTFDVPSEWERTGQPSAAGGALEYYLDSDDGADIHLRSSRLPGRITVAEEGLWEIQEGIENELQRDPAILGYRLDEVEVAERGGLPVFRVVSTLQTGDGMFDQLQYIVDGTAGHLFTFSAPSRPEYDLETVAEEIMGTVGKNPYARYMGLLPILLIAAFVGFYRLLPGGRGSF